MRYLSRLLPLALLALAAAPQAAAQKGNSKLITRDEILARPEAKTALEAVKKIRPNFLRLPSQTFAPGLAESRVDQSRKERALFVDEIPMDRLDQLNEIRAVDVYEIKILSPEEVVLYLGKQGYTFGAVVVTTMSRAPDSAKKPQ